MRKIYMLFIICCLINCQYANNAHSQFVKKSSKPFSLEEDIKFEREMINAQKANILQNTTNEKLINEIKSKNHDLRLRSISLMGYTADEDCRMEIENILLTDSSDEIRIAAANALEIIRSPKSETILIKALKDKNDRVKNFAATTLALIGEKTESLKFFSDLYARENIPYYSCHIGFLYIGTEEVKSYLLRDVNNTDSFIAIDAAIILAQIGYESDAFPVLKCYLANSDKYIRMAALRGLAYIGDDVSLQLIKSMINDEDPFVRERAYSIINKFN